MIKKLTIAAFLLISTNVHAAEIKLNNGDRITGEIVKTGSQKTVIKTSYGKLKIENKDIASIFDNKAKKPVTIINTPTKTQSSDSRIKNLISSAKMKGNANLGMSLNTGNSDNNSINADTKLTSKWEKHRAELKADFNREESNNVKTVNDKSISLAHDYFFDKKWFLNSFGGLEQDEIASIDLRSTAAFGLGYQMFEQDDLNLKFIAGPAYQNTHYDKATNKANINAKWAMDYDQKFFDDAFRLFHNHTLNAPMDEFDAYLFQSKSGIRLPLRKGIIATGQIDFDWNNAPAAGKTEDDTEYSLKLGYEW